MILDNDRSKDLECSTARTLATGDWRCLWRCDFSLLLFLLFLWLLCSDPFNVLKGVAIMPMQATRMSEWRKRTDSTQVAERSQLSKVASLWFGVGVLQSSPFQWVPRCSCATQAMCSSATGSSSGFSFT